MRCNLSDSGKFALNILRQMKEEGLSVEQALNLADIIRDTALLSKFSYPTEISAAFIASRIDTPRPSCIPQESTIGCCDTKGRLTPEYLKEVAAVLREEGFPKGSVRIALLAICGVQLDQDVFRHVRTFGLP